MKWYFNGMLHREDGPAIVWSTGTKEWWQNHQHHRLDGPAIEHADDTNYWYQYDKLHREDGPAIIDAAGVLQYWINNSELTREEFNQWVMKKNLNEKLHSTLQPKPTQNRSKI